jgi:hypothetical protein
MTSRRRRERKGLTQITEEAAKDTLYRAGSRVEGWSGPEVLNGKRLCPLGTLGNSWKLFVLS